MDKLNRFGQMRLDYLRTCQPALLERIKRNGTLFHHLLSSQRSIEWDLEQLVFSGLEEEAAERYVIQEYIQNPDLD
jgi:hypothetical protein